VSTVFLRARAAMDYLPVLHTDEQTRRFFARVVRQEQVYVAEVGSAVIGFAGWLCFVTIS